MAAPKGKKRAEPVIVEEVEEQLDPSQEADVVAAFEAEQEKRDKLEEFHSLAAGQDYRVRAELWVEADSSWVTLASFKLAGFDPHLALKRFCTPKYAAGSLFIKVRLVLLDERGKYVKGGITSLRLIVNEEEVKPAATDPLDSPAVKMVIESMRASSAGMIDMMKAAFGRPANGDSMGAKDILQLVTQVQALNPREDGIKRVGEIVGLLESLKGLLPQPEASSGEGGILSELSQAVKTAKDLGLLGRGSAINAPAIQHSPEEVSRPTFTPAGGAFVLQSPEPSPAPIKEKPMPKTDDPVESVLKRHLPIFVQWGRGRRDVERTADYLIEVVEDELIPAIKSKMPLATDEAVWAKLLEFAKMPSEVEKVFVLVPDLGPCADWARAVIAEAVKQLETPAEVPGVTDAA